MSETFIDFMYFLAGAGIATAGWLICSLIEDYRYYKHLKEVNKRLKEVD